MNVKDLLGYDNFFIILKNILYILININKGSYNYILKVLQISSTILFSFSVM